MNDEVYEEMYRVEARHWWFRAKHKIVRNLLHRYAPSKPGQKPRLVDLGCGCGYLLSLLKDEYDAVGLDGAPQAVAFTGRRGVSVRLGSLPDEVPFEDESVDVVLMLDVLEHLRDDGTCFDRAARLLKPGGIAICTVPAYPWLWTRRDDFHQHFRRYTRGAFETLVKRGPMRPEFVSHMNAALFPVALAERVIRKIAPLERNEGDLRVPVAPLNAAMRETYAAERWILGRLPVPVGLSLVTVTRKSA